jgi:hypothetical protein
MSPPMLPPDIILLICEELGNQRAFGTLLNAALSGKQIAASALLWLYRYFSPQAYPHAIPFQQYLAEYTFHILYESDKY